MTLSRLAIEVDGKRVAVDRLITEAQAREWLFDQAVRLTTREPVIINRRN